MRQQPLAWFLLCACLVFAQKEPGSQDPRGSRRNIDTEHSQLTIRVYKKGIFSAFAHDHEIYAPISTGFIDSAVPSVEFSVEVQNLKVRDPQLEAEKRLEVQQTMLGEKVLDGNRFPKIHFKATSIRKTSSTQWSLVGDLAMHGQTHPVTLAVTEESGHYTGSTTLNQSTFGITPISIGGGSIKVKDEVRIEFVVVAK